MIKTETRQNSGYARVAGAALIWGSIGLFVRALDIPVVTIVFFRFVFALVVAGVWFSVRRQQSPPPTERNVYILLVVSGIVLTFNWLFFFQAIVLTTVANAVLITYTAPIIVALLAPFFLKEKLELRTLVSLALSMSGISLIVSPTSITWGAPLIGIGFALLTSLTYAALVIIAKEMLPKLSIARIIFYQSLIATTLLAPFALLGPLPNTAVDWVLLLVMGAAHTVLAPYLYLSGLKTIRTQRAGVITYLDPLTATLLSVLFLAETPTVGTLAGGTLIIAAGLNIVRGEANRAD